VVRSPASLHTTNTTTTMHAQLGKLKGMTWQKRCVFRRRLKVLSVSDAVTLDGKVFQTRGAATKNASVVVSVLRYQ